MCGAQNNKAISIKRRSFDSNIYTTSPKDRCAKIYTTNPIERLNGAIKRRKHVVGIFPNEAAIIRLVRAILPEQNDKWVLQRDRYMTLETIAQLSDNYRVARVAT